MYQDNTPIKIAEACHGFKNLKNGILYYDETYWFLCSD